MQNNWEYFSILEVTPPMSAAKINADDIFKQFKNGMSCTPGLCQRNHTFLDNGEE